MHSAKDIVIRPIESKDARRIIQGLHYSKRVVMNSKIHYGVFLDGKCGGALSFGSSLDKRKMSMLVEDTKMHEFVELNRMALAEWLPRNSESRSISICLRLIKKNNPHIKWVVSFADGCQCGDGTIYRASGFVLTGMKKSKNLIRMGDGIVIHKMTLESNPNAPRKELGGKTYFELTGGKYNFKKYTMAVNGVVLEGRQFRYVYFLDPSCRKKLTVEEIPFSEIDKCGAGMYKGQTRSKH